MKRGFARSEWRVNKIFLVHTGVMFDDFSIGCSSVSPMLALNYFSSDNASIRASLSQAYRYPMGYEENGNVSLLGIVQLVKASGGIEPSRIRSAEIGYVAYSDDRNSFYELRIYRDKVIDLIPHDDTSGITDFTNASSAELEDFEAQFDARFIQGKTRLIASYAYVDIDSPNLLDNLSDSGPQHIIGLMLIHDIGQGWDGSVVYNHVSEMKFLSQSIPVPEINKLDVKFRKSFKVYSTKTKLTFSAINLLDNHIDFMTENDRGR
jgi:outer membrane receptor protein involved in Fe transport